MNKLVNGVDRDMKESNIKLERPKKKKSKTTRFRLSEGLSWSTRVYPAEQNSSLNPNSCDYSANSRYQRYWLTIKILAVSLFSAVMLLVFISMDVHEALTLVQRDTAIKEAVDVSIKVADLIHCLQVERGLTVLSISSNQNSTILTVLETAHSKTSAAIKDIPTWPSNVPSNIFRSEEIFNREIENHRYAIDYGRNSTIKKEILFYTSIINFSLNWLFRSFMNNTSDKRIFDLLGYQMFLVSKDRTGIERALGGSFFSRGHFNETEDLLWYAEQKIIGDAFLKSSMDLMTLLGDLYKKLVSQQTAVMSELEAKRSIILENKPAPGNDTAGQHWFSLITKYMNILLKVQKSAGEHISGNLKTDVEYKETKLTVNCIVLVLVIVLTPLMVIAVVRMTSTIQKYAAQLEFTTENLKEEQQRTDAVLSAMFPQSVAETLKRGEKVNSEYFDNVTVFFSDIVNFTNICSVISPLEVTTMLNAIYSGFDDTIDKYDVYKVETIGDAYMVVSGLPVRNGNNHVDEICRMAFDLVQVTHDFELVEAPGEVLLIRVGIHTGPCVSGIVGIKMPRYCLFGDTVNTASRMQTTGLPQKIHISETTLQLLNHFNGYETEHRGEVDVKGKGLMQTYWLNSCLGSSIKSEAGIN